MNTNQLIHISSEIVVLLGFTYYLQRQITKLSGVYTELKQRMDETEQLNNKRFDMLLNMIEDNVAQQVQYNRMSNFMPSMSVHPQQHMNNPNVEDVGLRNRKTKRAEPTPNNKPSSSEPMRLNKKSESTPPQNVSQQQPQQPNIFPFNPLDLLNSISGMASSPVFSATIVTDNIVPQAQKTSDIKIVEIEDDEEQTPEKLDEDIQEELKDLLSNEDSSVDETGEKTD